MKNFKVSFTFKLSSTYEESLFLKTLLKVRITANPSETATDFRVPL